jgi:hypothetical protein
VGVPLGFYWLRRGGAFSQSSQNYGRSPTGEPAPLAQIQPIPTPAAKTTASVATQSQQPNDARLESLERKIDSLQSEFNTFRWSIITFLLVGVVVCCLVALIDAG